MPKRRNGSITPAVLARSDSVNAANDHQSHFAALDRFASESSWLRRKKRSDEAKKNMESVFFRSVIQATDSTFTGCTTKSSAAHQAPGIFSRASTRQSRMALKECRRTFVT